MVDYRQFTIWQLSRSQKFFRLLIESERIWRPPPKSIDYTNRIGENKYLKYFKKKERDGEFHYTRRTGELEGETGWTIRAGTIRHGRLPRQFEIQNVFSVGESLQFSRRDLSVDPLSCVIMRRLSIFQRKNSYIIILTLHAESFFSLYGETDGAE